ncbi:MAG: hypothetical protein ACREJQ_02455 [bacterium]
MKKAGWLAIFAVGIVAVGVWYFTRPQPAPQPAASASKPPATQAEELPLNPAPADGSELITLGKPLTKITIYPRLRLGVKLEFAKDTLNHYALKYKEDLDWDLAFPQLTYMVKGKVFGMPRELPILFHLISSDGYLVAFEIESPDLSKDDSDTLFRHWRGALARVFGNPKTDDGWPSILFLAWEWPGKIYKVILFRERESGQMGVYFQLRQPKHEIVIN